MFRRKFTGRKWSTDGVEYGSLTVVLTVGERAAEFTTPLLATVSVDGVNIDDMDLKVDLQSVRDDAVFSLRCIAQMIEDDIDMVEVKDE